MRISGRSPTDPDDVASLVQDLATEIARLEEENADLQRELDTQATTITDLEADVERLEQAQNQ